MKRTFSFLVPVLFAGFLVTDHKPQNMQNDPAQIDGPYVLYKGKKIFVNYIHDQNGSSVLKTDSFPLEQKQDILLKVAAGKNGETFKVRLKKELAIEKPEFSGVTKMLVISDIEGEFDAFKKLLTVNNVMDEKFNWTFGNGHLILTGDFFDRGIRVTETLWLIYSLEEKAKDGGGYVHFVLGNHEIMNLNNDLRYVHPKYMESAKLMNEHYLSLYGENAELGRWLRTKNITEKVGNVLFMHAGISSYVNLMDLSLTKMNKLARPFYSDTTYNYKDPKVDILFSDFGPFWYRGYYHGTPKASLNQIDSTLSLYKVKHIATGHTVIADTISVLHKGKLINTDVHHSKGHSEALLIDNGKFYRVTSFGEKFLLFE
jgi:hypothetical protein